MVKIARSQDRTSFCVRSQISNISGKLWCYFQSSNLLSKISSFQIFFKSSQFKMSLDAGINISKESLVSWNDFKMNKKYDFVVYRISSDQKFLIPEVCVPLGESQKVHNEEKDSISVTKEQDEQVEYWNMRRLVLESGEPRYASIMVPMKNCSHPALIFWSPPSKLSMIYTTTSTKFKSRLTGAKGLLQCNDLEELSFSEVVLKYKSK